MHGAVEIASQFSVLAFAFACMAAAGLGLSPREILAPLRRAGLVAGTLVANFVLAPLVAYMLARTVTLAPPHETGLLLLGGAAGAPFLPRLTALARGDLAFSVGLTLLLAAGTVVTMPVVLPLLIPGLSADPWPIFRPLFWTMLLPLAGGLAVRARLGVRAARLGRLFHRVSNVSLAAALVLLIGSNVGPMLGVIGSGAVAVAVVFVSLTFAAGYAFGGPTAGARAALGLGTGQRNVAAALVIATQSFSDPGVAVMLLVSTFAGLAVLIPAARILARRTEPGSPPVRPGPEDQGPERLEPLPLELNR